MSERPSTGIGKRLAKYRNLAGMSARELSEKIDGELSRGVIANIESGRKTDVTIDQLVALAWALGVPPAVLALPADEPYKFVRMGQGPNRQVSWRSYVAVEWFQNEPARFDGIGPDTNETPAGALAQQTIRAVRDLPKYEKEFHDAKALQRRGKLDDEAVSERESKYLQHQSVLRQLGVNLTVFKVDE